MLVYQRVDDFTCFTPPFKEDFPACQRPATFDYLETGYLECHPTVAKLVHRP
jgi:hypothetical protein